MNYCFRMFMLACSVFLGTCAFGGEDVHSQRFKNPVELEVFINKAMKDLKVPGMAVGIVKGDKVLYAKGFGVREIGRPEKVDINTIFPIASFTKSFTATLAAKLVDQKKLSWDTKIIDHLPWFRLSEAYATKEATLTDFLSHRTGLARGGDMSMFGYSNREAFTSWKKIPLAPSFRSNFHYGSLTYDLIGELESTVGGTSWDKLIEKEILDPLGMKQTFTTWQNAASYPNKSAGHEVIGNQIYIFKAPNIWGIFDSAGASIYSSLSDLCKFAIFQLQQGMYDGKQIISKEHIQRTHSPHCLMDCRDPESDWLSSGLGWYIGQQTLPGKENKLPMVRNGGSYPGVISDTVLYPTEDLGVVVMANQLCGSVARDIPKILTDYYYTGKISQASKEVIEKARIVLEAQINAPIPPKNRTYPPMKLSYYTGTYNNKRWGNIEIVETKRGLQLKFPTQAFDLEHQCRDTFVMRLPESYDKANQERFKDATGETAQITFMPSSDNDGCPLFHWYALAEAHPELSSLFERVKTVQ